MTRKGQFTLSYLFLATLLFGVSFGLLALPEPDWLPPYWATAFGIVAAHISFACFGAAIGGFFNRLTEGALCAVGLLWVLIAVGGLVFELYRLPRTV